VAAPTLQEQLHLLLEAAPRVAGADSATIYLCDDVTGTLRVVARYGFEPATMPHPRPGGITEHVLGTGELVIVDDTATDPRVSQVVRDAGIRSFVALPLLVRRATVRAPTAAGEGVAVDVAGAPPAEGAVPAVPEPALPAGEAGGLRPIGVLYVNARRPRAFDAATLEGLKGLAALAAVAIENGYLLAAQRAAAQDLAEALRLREQFAWAAAHELKGPLTPLKGYAQAMQRRLERAAARGEPVDLAWLRRALGMMVSQIDRLDRLVTDLLDVSRLRAGHFTISPEPADLVDLARRALERFREMLALQAEAGEEEVQHTLRFECRADALPGVWDTGRLEQLIFNLLSNAVKYSPDGGVVELLVEPVCAAGRRPDEPGGEETRPGACGELDAFRRHAPAVGPGWVHLAVRDEGIGLPPDESARAALFRPFTRGLNVPARRVPGFGLGLFICAEIARRHGGTVWAESPGERQGSTFHVLLPPQPPPAPSNP
jgi:signal transduction histidine kinase